MAGTPLSGTRGRVTVKGVGITLSFFRVAPNADSPIGTSFEDYDTATGYVFETTVLGGVQRATIELRGYWNSDANPFLVAGGKIIPGQNISALLCFIDRVGNRGWTFPLAYVMEGSTSTDLNGRSDFQATCRNQGPFSYPV